MQFLFNEKPRDSRLAWGYYLSKPCHRHTTLSRQKKMAQRDVKRGTETTVETGWQSQVFLFCVAVRNVRFELNRRRVINVCVNIYTNTN